MEVNLEVLKCKIASKLVEELKKYQLPDKMLSKKATFICSKKNLRELVESQFLPKDLTKYCSDMLFLFAAQGEIESELGLKLKLEKLNQQIVARQLEQNTNFVFDEKDIKEKVVSIPTFTTINEALDFWQSLKDKNAKYNRSYYGSWSYKETKEEALQRQAIEFTCRSREFEKVNKILLEEKDTLEKCLLRPKDYSETQVRIDKLAKEYQEEHKSLELIKKYPEIT